MKKYVGRTFADITRNILNISVLLIMSSMMNYANADTYSCTGKVDTVTVTPGGIVNASFTFTTGVMYWKDLCGVDSPLNSVTISACKASLAILLTAKASGQNIQMWFNNANSGNCSAPAWGNINGSGNPMGWYWGPAIVN